MRRGTSAEDDPGGGSKAAVREDDLGDLTSWRQSGEWSSRASRAGNRRASAGDTPWIGAKT